MRRRLKGYLTSTIPINCVNHISLASMQEVFLKKLHQEKMSLSNLYTLIVKPKVDHLRVFGSTAYAHVLNQGRSKLDDRSVKHVFIGYDANSKDYNLYNLNIEKIIVSRDIEFVEIYFEEAPNEFSTSLPPSTPSIHEVSFSKRTSSERTRKMRSIQEIYDEIEMINDLFCLFVESGDKPLKEEIKAIKKNDNYELSNLQKGHEVFKIKKNVKEEVGIYKIRLVSKVTSILIKLWRDLWKSSFTLIFLLKERVTSIHIHSFPNPYFVLLLSFVPKFYELHLSRSESAIST
ncbi:hypothetical protein CR513_30382, partial [Mucuna pruriens]